MTRTILVTGGAGYVGSHIVWHLLDLGWQPVVFDDLSTGHRELVPPDAILVEGSLLDATALATAFDDHTLDGVVHCAARSIVPESVRRPTFYYRENILGAAELIDAAGARELPIVFSSSAAVYGIPQALPITEATPCAPINPYGFTKLAIEQLLADAARAFEQRSIALRYFNAAGADLDGRSGERHEPETHLIPNILAAALAGDTEAREPFKLFGDDYPTRDGTCLRDYVHVADLARAHSLALERLWREDVCESINLGSGHGATVREVFDTARQVTGCEIPVRVVGRRPGDPAELLASTEAAADKLGWSPRHSDLTTILETAWRWHRREQAHRMSH